MYNQSYYFTLTVQHKHIYTLFIQQKNNGILNKILHFKNKMMNSNNNTTYLNVDPTDITTFCNVAMILEKKEMMGKHLI